MRRQGMDSINLGNQLLNHVGICVGIHLLPRLRFFKFLSMGLWAWVPSGQSSRGPFSKRKRSRTGDIGKKGGRQGVNTKKIDTELC